MKNSKVAGHERVSRLGRSVFGRPASATSAGSLTGWTTHAVWRRVSAHRSLFSVFLVLLLALGGAVRPAHAHGDLHERIERLDKQIAASPDDYILYLKRGDLHRQHQEWSLAVADFEQAQRLASRPIDVDYYLGLTWLEAGEPAKAIASLDRYLEAHPDQPQALLTRAHARVALGEYNAAAADYSRVIDLLAQPTPDLYTAKAGALLAEGDSQLDAAMDVIRQGVRRIGPIVSLIEYAVTTETAHGRYDKALAWIGDLPENIATQPLWLARRADVLVMTGRNDAALADYRSAYEAVMQNLQRRNTPANLAFEAELRDKIATLDK